MSPDPSVLQLAMKSLLGSLLTLYMMALLLRWLAPWLELELSRGWLRVIPRAADPLINLMRRLLPPMGPMDWGPVAAVVLVWIVRIILVNY
ncbi:MAG: YggT family protein [Candidatus Hydrogenedentes bacterium]|nr:YggT family protein [Candidatus Hydrogenedentota bacterium]MBI3118861.1 YggT family protein [Candidatus Hydrogenedentota bacterium]